jgi:protein TonB
MVYRDEPLHSDISDLSNVVPFARPRRHGPTEEFPLPSVASDDRPAPLPRQYNVAARIALLAASIALHGLVLAAFLQEEPPQASIGTEVISVEVTLGGTQAAGLASMPGEQEAQVVTPSEQPALDEPETEPTVAATAMPQEVPVAAQEAAPDAKPEEQPAPETASDAPALTQAEERPPEPVAQTAPERTRLEAVTKDKAAQKKQVTAATTDSASGIGRGRSDATANYNGMIAAHLGRHRQYPADARSAGLQGVATVSFTFDGGGRVTSVRLVRGSGVGSIDREAVAMVHRASPFPRPPDGQAHNFTVPVSFNLR